MTPAQAKRDRKKLNRQARLRLVKPCSVCGSVRHQGPGYLCRRYRLSQRAKGVLRPLPSGKSATSRAPS